MSAAPRDPAKARFFILQAMRLAGVGLVVLGMAVMNGKLALPLPLTLPPRAGVIIALAGVVSAFFVPIFLTRAWKTPRP